MNQLNYAQALFEQYYEAVQQSVVDIRFWEHFQSQQIKKYIKDYPVNQLLNEAGFTLYNFESDKNSVWLHYSDKTDTIYTNDLSSRSESFFEWIENLTLVRIYNAMELLLLQALSIKYFPTHIDIINSKLDSNKIKRSITDVLKNQGINNKGNNNRYIIEYLKLFNSNCQSFFQIKFNPEWDITWEDLFVFVGTFRNVITHFGMLLTPSTRNSLNSYAADLLNHYYKPSSNKDKAELLRPMNTHIFLDLVDRITDFTFNILKFISGESDFTFIGLRGV